MWLVGFYQNIPHQEGLDSLEQAVNLRKDKTVPTKILIDLMQHVLENNFLEYDQKLYQNSTLKVI